MWLIIGLVAIAIFETILGVLRTYLFAHTTNLESHGDLPSP
jgi:subfamily B ATP-binding cassette protein HlyB/CyaB